MIIDEKKVSLAKDIIFNSSDIETINAINYLKIINSLKDELNNNMFNIKFLNKFINECIGKYDEIKDIIKNNSDYKIYLYKREYYLKRLENVEIGIYVHILLLKGKIKQIHDILYVY